MSQENFFISKEAGGESRFIGVLGVGLLTSVRRFWRVTVRGQVVRQQLSDFGRPFLHLNVNKILYSTLWVVHFISPTRSLYAHGCLTDIIHPYHQRSTRLFRVVVFKTKSKHAGEKHACNKYTETQTFHSVSFLSWSSPSGTGRVNGAGGEGLTPPTHTLPLHPLPA